MLHVEVDVHNANILDNNYPVACSQQRGGRASFDVAKKWSDAAHLTVGKECGCLVNTCNIILSRQCLDMRHLAEIS